MPVSSRQSTRQISKFLKQSEDFAEKIKNNEAGLVKLLSKYETHETIYDEIERSLKTLEGFKQEMEPIKNPLSDLTVATFFPLNLPLYSLTLFAIAPSAFSKDVFVRPPQIMSEILEKLWDLLDVNEFFPNISLKKTPRDVFVKLYAREADAIMFTGKYENALDIHEKCPQTLLLYNGSGINPFVVFDNANIKLAAKKAVEMRLFNSGQDCAGPDAFFVQASQADGFIEQLTKKLDKTKIGDTTNVDVSVGPTLKVTYIDQLKKWLSKEKKNVIYGGKIDTDNNLVYPTIIKKNIQNINEDTDFHEFFAPFFYVIIYEDIAELKSIILSKRFKARTMYISVFGDNPNVEKRLSFSKILKNKIVNDVERGNNEYGGWGQYSNFLLYRNKKEVSPVLISRDLHKKLQN